LYRCDTLKQESQVSYDLRITHCRGEACHLFGSVFFYESSQVD